MAQDDKHAVETKNNPPRAGAAAGGLVVKFNRRGTMVVVGCGGAERTSPGTTMETKRVNPPPRESVAPLGDAAQTVHHRPSESNTAKSRPPGIAHQSTANEKSDKLLQKSVVSWEFLLPIGFLVVVVSPMGLTALVLYILSKRAWDHDRDLKRAAVWGESTFQFTFITLCVGGVLGIGVCVGCVFLYGDFSTPQQNVTTVTTAAPLKPMVDIRRHFFARFNSSNSATLRPGRQQTAGSVPVGFNLTSVAASRENSTISVYEIMRRFYMAKMEARRRKAYRLNSKHGHGLP